MLQSALLSTRTAQNKATVVLSNGLAAQALRLYYVGMLISVGDDHSTLAGIIRASGSLMPIEKRRIIM